VTGIDLLNRASMAGRPALRDLRAKALDALYSIAPGAPDPYARRSWGALTGLTSTKFLKQGI
jgi:hypothetical protein